MVNVSEQGRCKPRFCVLEEIVPDARSIAKLVEGKCRKYAGAVRCSLDVRGTVQHSTMHTQYEVQSREWYFDSQNNNAFRRGLWWEHVRGKGSSKDSAAYQTPQSMIQVLQLSRFKAISTPSWATFNFDQVVCVLGGMMAMMSIDPSLSTEDFRGWAPYDVRGVVQAGDLYAVQQNTGVYMDTFLSHSSAREALWALTTAVNISGAKAIHSHVDCGPEGRACCVELKGADLTHGISVALSMLAGYYDAANLGDAYALALVRGITRVMTVVGHSDEGGWFRDLLRLNTYPTPWGGIPKDVPIPAGLPILDGRSPAFTIRWVDSILLGSHALVAHCDPMICKDGEYYPTVVMCSDDYSGLAGALAVNGLRTHMARQLASHVYSFAPTYCRGLGKLFGLATYDQPDYSPAYIKEAADALALEGSRHTEYEVLAPFFVIEPTGILPRNFLGGTPAELYGCGALVSMGEHTQVPLFEESHKIGRGTDMLSDWNVKYRSARTCGFALYTGSHRDNGAALLQIRQFDPTRICLSRQSTDALDRMMDNEGYATLGDLLWVRGQSKIPHPAEVLNPDLYLGVSIVHLIKDRRGRLSDIHHIPSADEIATSRLTLYATCLMFHEVGKQNIESNEVRRLRNRGVDALHYYGKMGKIVARTLHSGLEIGRAHV